MTGAGARMLDALRRCHEAHVVDQHVTFAMCTDNPPL